MMVAATLSQLSATGTTDRPPPSAEPAPPEVTPLAFSQVRSALIKALRTSPDAREPLCDALELLEMIQQRLEHDRQSMSPAPAAPAPARPRGRLQEYQIQTSADGQFLTERRPGHSQPFRCPRATYDAAAEVLARAEQPMHFDELAERLNAHLGHRQPDYRLRVALRFWLGGNAVLRSRTKYRPADRSTFRDTARRLWEELAKRSARPQT
jgi:hypothetical protein